MGFYFFYAYVQTKKYVLCFIKHKKNDDVDEFKDSRTSESLKNFLKMAVNASKKMRGGKKKSRKKKKKTRRARFSKKRRRGGRKTVKRRRDRRKTRVKRRGGKCRSSRRSRKGGGRYCSMSPGGGIAQTWGPNSNKPPPGYRRCRSGE